jgi:N-hydroxyarylamine O-acetyltransferase
MTDESAAIHNKQIDLAAYLRRIGYDGELQPTQRVLELLHLAHVTHIPFENLDVLLKRPIRLDICSLQEKLVTAGRGGYCFEQNGLFAAVLREIGFQVTNLAARVHYRATRTRPRTHRISLVTVDGTRFLADVGFGAAGLFLPVPVDGNQLSRQYTWSYRIVEREGLRFLQTVQEGDWTDLYSFSMEPQEAADYEMANYYVSTHPDSQFVRALTIQRATPEERHALRGSEYTLDRGDQVIRRALGDIHDLETFIAETFGVTPPPGYRFILAEAGIQVQSDTEYQATITCYNTPERI